MSKKQIIRVGDRVRIVRNRFTMRVGYPLVFTDLREEVKNDPCTSDALNVLGWKGRMPQYFVDAVAKLRVEQRGFGGKQRQIFYMPHQGDWGVGQVSEVLGKRTARTSTYYPPYYGYSYTDYGPEYDYIPGGLDSPKTHVILSTAYGEIEACDVELASRK